MAARRRRRRGGLRTGVVADWGGGRDQPHDQAALIRLNRPEARNAISMVLMTDFTEAVRSASAGGIHGCSSPETTRHFHRGAI